jgi:hypothetical protein
LLAESAGRVDSEKTQLECSASEGVCLLVQETANNAINSDHKKLRFAPHFVSGYGWRYVR